MAVTADQLALPSGERRADPTPAVFGIVAAGIAAVVLMGALLGAWLALRSGTDVWPPKGVKIENYYGTTLSATALMATIAGWWALFGVRRAERGQAVVALALVIFLQGAFINLLTYVIRGAHFGPATHPYGVLYYAMNVAIIAIAAGGMIVAAVAAARVLGGQVTPAEPQLGWAAAWFCTAVAAAWLVMYYAVYVAH